MLNNNTLYIRLFGDPEASSRYSKAKSLLPINNKIKGLRLLDVGGGWRTIFPELRKKVVKGEVLITSADINFEKDIFKECIKYVRLKPDSKLPFKSNSYDIVISVDSLEHVPPKSRRSFVSELFRVSGAKVVLAFPTGDESTAQDTLLYNFSKESCRPIHRYFEEHLEYGLPDIKDFEKLVRKSKYKLVREVKQGNLKIRGILMKLWIKYPLAYRTLGPLATFLLNINFGKCYRKYYLFEK